MLYCPDCLQGRLLIVKAATGRLFLLCEECESAWDDPVAILNGRGNFDFEQGRRDFAWEDIAEASDEDVRNAGWESLPRE
ncbi:hypothetical protein [Asticcacaulis solisilvae]|uniref:hypothetical protein n=1 Tax=Asticcacaulis solisilvae TaxID=1217274 RepID=UPI003FD73884